MIPNSNNFATLWSQNIIPFCTSVEHYIFFNFSLSFFSICCFVFVALSFCSFGKALYSRYILYPELNFNIFEGSLIKFIILFPFVRSRRLVLVYQRWR